MSLWLTFLLGLNVPAHGQTASATASAMAGAAGHELTLTECVELARGRSPQAVQGSLIEIQATAARDEVKRARLPQLLAVGNFEKSDDVKTQLPDANKAVVRLEQTAFPFSGVWLRANQLEGELRAARYTHIESEQDVALLVKQLYFSILKEQDAIARLIRVEEQLKRLLTAVIPRYSVGRTPPFDLVKIRTSISDLARTRELTEAQLAGDKSQLAQALGFAPGQAPALRPIEKLPEVKDGSASSGGVAANPSLLALTERFHAAELGVSAARYNRYPSLVAGLEYGYAGQTSDDMSRGWSLTVGLRLPLFDWGIISAQVASASALSRQATNQFELERQKAVADLTVNQAMASAHLSDQVRLNGLLNETHRAALITLDRYKRGAAGILEASEAVSLWIQTLLNERSAFYSYLSDLAKIDRLRGTRDYENL